MDRSRFHVLQRTLVVLAAASVFGLQTFAFGGGANPDEIKAKMQRVQKILKRWQSEGKDLSAVLPEVQKIQQLAQQGNPTAVEDQIDKVLGLLDAPKSAQAEASDGPKIDNLPEPLKKKLHLIHEAVQSKSQQGQDLSSIHPEMQKLRDLVAGGDVAAIDKQADAVMNALKVRPQNAPAGPQGRLQAKIHLIQKTVKRWQSEGKDLSKIAPEMQKIQGFAQANDPDALNKHLDHILALLGVELSEKELEDLSRNAPARGGGGDFIVRRVNATGVGVGEYAPQAEVFTTNGEPVALSSAWASRPAMIVTASITCPIAKNSCPSVALKEHDFGDRVNTVILYTIEAHPRDGRSPYDPHKGERAPFPYDQPDELTERLKLARIFAEKITPGVHMIVDNMGNEAWLSLGGGPNMALLIDTDGKVLLKQPWFKADQMIAKIDELSGR